MWFGLCFDAANEQLRVSILRVRNLPSRTLGESNRRDPFVRVYLLPDERRFMQTKSKPQSCNPTFNETFVYHVRQREEVIGLTD